MKRLFFCVMFAVLPVAAQAAETTAYSAIRAVAKKVGDDALGRVIEVRGKGGAPEPQVWKVVLADNGSRGGVREYEVQKGKVSGERSPSGRSGGPPLDLNKVNVDSDGAFTIVNQETQKTKLPFDRIDYTLTGAGRSSNWHVEIYDGRNGRIGSLDIAADTGNVTNRDFQGANRAVAQDDRDFLRDQSARDRRSQPPVYDDNRKYDDRRSTDDRRNPDDRRYADDRRYPDDGRRMYQDEEEVGPGITDIFGKIGRHFQKRGQQMKSFFGGH